MCDVHIRPNVGCFTCIQWCPQWRGSCAVCGEPLHRHTDGGYCHAWDARIDVAYADGWHDARPITTPNPT